MNEEKEIIIRNLKDFKIINISYNIEEMSYCLNFGYDQQNNDSLCMKENIQPTEYSCLKSYQSNDNLIMMQFKIDMNHKLLSGYENKSIYKLDCDYENISKYLVIKN